MYVLQGWYLPKPLYKLTSSIGSVSTKKMCTACHFVTHSSLVTISNCLFHILEVTN